MRITIVTTDRALVFMRRAGYGLQREQDHEVAFVRRVGASPFPRYHAYVTEAPSIEHEIPNMQTLQLNLHVDQKAPTYERGHVHSGEYEGPLVVEEAARLRGLTHPCAGAPPTTSGTPPERQRGFFGKLFG